MRFQKKLLFIALLLFLNSSLQAASISGTLIPKSIITLDKIHPFSKTNQQIATTQSDENGYFEFDIEVTEQPENFLLATETASLPFLATKGGEYTFLLADRKLVLTKENNSEINAILLELNQKLLAKRDEIVGDKKNVNFTAADLDVLNEWKIVYGNKPHIGDFLKYHIFSTQISWFYFYKGEDRDQRIQQREKEHFINAKVDGSNPEYLTSLAYYLNLRKELYGGRQYFNIASLLKVADRFENSQLRQVATLLAFRNFYIQKYYPKGDIEKLNKKLDKEADRYPDFTDWASNLKTKYNQFLLNSTFPEVRLPNQHGEVELVNKTLSKRTIIDFWATWCVPCRNEMKRIPSILKKYKQLEIVSISVDAKQETMNTFIQKYGYDWTFLYTGPHHPVLEELNINAYPTYFVLDEKGKIIATGHELHLLEKYF